MNEEFEQPNDGGGNAEVDNRPLVERIGDKNWKTRLVAYEELRVALKSTLGDDPLFAEYGPWLVKMTADSNAGALDAALDTAIVYVDLAPSSSSSSGSSSNSNSNSSGDYARQHALTDKVIGNVVDKAFSGKSSTVGKGKALLLKIMEVAGNDGGNKECCGYLLAKLADKKPKVPPTCLEVIREALVAFGARALPVKDIIAALGPVFNGSNGPAREQAMSLMLELSRWVGKAPLNALLESIRSAQKTEFEKALSERETEGGAGNGPPAPTVWLRKERPVAGAGDSDAVAGAGASVGGSGKSSGTGAGAGTGAGMGAIDAREYVEEVDLQKRLKGSEFAALVASEKWSEQLKALQLVIDALGPTPKVKAGCDVHDVVSACKGVLRQGHLQVQLAALKIVALLADGMRAEFASAVRPITQAVVGKCKEKKLVGEVQAALSLVLRHCLQFDSLAEDVNEHIRNKKVPPHGRVCMMEFLCTALAAGTPLDARDRLATDALKPLAEALVSCCEDSDPKVRDVAAVCLAALAPLVRSRGRPALDAHKVLVGLEQTAPRVFKKMQAALDGTAGAPAPAVSASSNSSSSSAGSARPATAPTKKPSASTFSSTSSSSSPPKHTDGAIASSGSSRFDDDVPPVPAKRPATASAAPPKRPGGLVSKSATGGAGGAAKKASAATAGPDKDDENVEDLAMGAEDAQEQLAALGVEGWEGPVQEAMVGANWQAKVDAVVAIGQKISEAKAGGRYSAPLVVYLSAKTAGFKINNINILKAVIQTACLAAQSAGEEGDEPFSRPAGWELLKHLGDKLSDKKTKDPVCGLMTALAAALKPAFVVKRMRVVMDKTKAPLAHQHYLEWLKEAVAEFGASAFPVQALGAFCQAALDNKVAAVRTAAVEVMGALYHQIGPRLAAVVQSDDMKPAVRALLDAEYARVGHDPSASSKAPKAGAVAAGGEIPRQDLFALVDKNIVSELTLVEGKNSWQNRKTAIEAVISACERSGHYLDAPKGSSALADVLKALKARVNDTQANLKPIAAAAIGHLIASLDPEPGAKHLRAVAAGLIGGLGDNKKPMRDATVAALQMAVTLNRPAPAATELPLLAALIAPLGEALVATAVGRQELLAFLLPFAQAEPCCLRAPVDCSELTAPLVLAMQDKTAAVRSLAEQLLGLLAAQAIVSKQALDKATRDLAPAAKRSIMPSVDRMLAAHGSKKAGAVEAATAAGGGPTWVVVPAVSATEESAATTATATAVVPPIATDEPAPSSAAKSTRNPSALASSTLSVSASLSVSVAAASMPLPPSPSAADNASWALKKTNKARRVEDFHRCNWPQPPEEPSEHELTALRAVWEPLISPDLAALVFAKSSVKFGQQLVTQDQCLPAINELLALLALPCPHTVQHSDLLLRYACYALCVRETATGLLKVLALITEIFALLKSHGQSLHEAEVSCVLPQLIDKSGHKSERHKAAFKSTLMAAADVMTPSKLCQVLLQGLASKNKKTRVVCLEEIQRVVESDSKGAAALGRAGVREVAVYLDSKDNDVSGRHACLELCYALYLALGGDLPKLSKLLGELSERSSSMVEDRVRQKNKQAGVVPATATATATATASNAGAASGASARPLTSTTQAQPPQPAQQQQQQQPSLRASYASPSPADRDRDRDSAAGSPSPFRLEITPEQPAVAADYGPLSPTRLYATLDPTLPTPPGQHKAKPLSLSPTLPQMAANWAAPTPGATLRSRASPLRAAAPSSPSRMAAGAASPTRTSPRRGRADTASAPSSSTPRAASRSPTRRAAASPSVLASARRSPTKAPSRSPTPATDAVSGLVPIFEDIESKVDMYLTAVAATNAANTATATGTATGSEAPVNAAELQALCDEAKDYLKMLHSIVSGEWSKETPLPEDERALHQRAESLCRRLVACVAISFNRPTTPTASPTSLFGIDVSLVAVALATLFAVVRRPDLSRALSAPALEVIFHQCLCRIVDPRLSSAVSSMVSPASQESSKETAQQVVRALNIVLLKLASEAPTGAVICALVHVLLLCIPASEIDPAARATCLSGESMPSSSTKPASRLLLRVLAEESKRSRPFADPTSFPDNRGGGGGVGVLQVLTAVHEFLALQPSVGTVDETPLTTVRAVLSELVKALGGAPVMAMLLELQLPTTAAIYRVTSRLANVPIPEPLSAHAGAGSAATTPSKAAAASLELHQTLVALIDEITSARDKMAPIRRLHALKQHTPSIDVQPYLQTISAAFRRFVLDSLAKLDAESGNPGSSGAGAGSARKSLAGPVLSVAPPAAVPSAESPNENKTGNADAYPGAGTGTGTGTGRDKLTQSFSEFSMDGSSGGGVGGGLMRTGLPLTPRGMMNSRIRGSLNSLSQALSLPAETHNGPVYTNSSNTVNSSSSSGFSATSVLAAKGPSAVPTAAVAAVAMAGDSDLAARLQRLKDMQR